MEHRKTTAILLFRGLIAHSTVVSCSGARAKHGSTELNQAAWHRGLQNVRLVGKISSLLEPYLCTLVGRGRLVLAATMIQG